MKFLSRLIVFLIMSISFTAPAGATVVVDVDSYCGAINADDDKKPDDVKKPGEDEEEPDCD
jgi:hypothetical protein